LFTKGVGNRADAEEQSNPSLLLSHIIIPKFGE